MNFVGALPRAEVDLVIVGGGIQGVMLARALRDRYALALISGQPRLSETLHGHGYLAAGYRGEEADNVGRASGVCRQWRGLLDELDLPYRSSEIYYMPPPPECETWCARWREFSLRHEPIDEAPPPFRSSRLGRVYAAPDDLVFDPARTYRALRAPLLEQIVAGEAEAFGHDREGRVAFVRVHTGQGSVVLDTRYLALTAGAANSGLVFSLLGQNDEAMRCQQLRQVHMLCLRGDLPLTSGGFEEMAVVAHDLGPNDRLWLVSFHDHPEPPQPGVVLMGVEPPVARSVLSQIVSRLRSWIPDFESWAARLRWSVYTGWKTEGPEDAPQPPPHRLSELELGNVMAVWPCMWGNALEAAREASERIVSRLGPSKAPPLDRGALGLPPPCDDPVCSKWLGPELDWQDWASFRARFMEG